jgi:hypothetical protein
VICVFLEHSGYALNFLGSAKTRPTFSDAIAWGRRQLWEHIHFSMSHQETDLVKIPRAFLERFSEALCYAA